MKYPLLVLLYILFHFYIFLYTYSAAIWRGVLLSLSLTSNLAPCLIRVLRIYKNETIYTITQVRDTSFSFTNNCYFSIYIFIHIDEWLNWKLKLDDSLFTKYIFAEIIFKLTNYLVQKNKKTKENFTYLPTFVLSAIAD
jgi:hypothetical protein